MNYRGSYRKLLGNAKAAMMAAVEIYNKPSFDYRDECIVILMLNGWELALKAALSKNAQSVFYPKKRKHPYRTLSWQDAFARAEPLFPRDISPLPVRRNLELLGTYRDNAVHFYNANGFGAIIYALAQTCIKNFRDYLEGVFHQRLEEEISWHLFPLGIKPPFDVATYMSSTDVLDKPSSVRQFLAELAQAADDVKNAGQDTGRLMTIFNVQLESVKKIGDADLVVGVTKAGEANGPLVVVRRQDPNVTHPLRQKEIVEMIGTLHGGRFTAYIFQATAWKYDLRNQPQYCWKATGGVLIKYSNDVVPFIKRLSVADLEASLKDYRNHLRKKKKEKEAS